MAPAMQLPGKTNNKRERMRTKVKDEINTIVALIAEQSHKEGTDLKIYEDAIIAFIDELIVLPEPFDILSDVFIAIIVDKALDKANDPEWRATQLEKVSVRSNRLITKIKERGI